MMDLDVQNIKYLNTGEILPEIFFMNAYMAKVFESDHVHFTLNNFVQF